MKLVRLLFVILPTLFFLSVETVSAETRKVGSWRLEFSQESCIMMHDGWGQDLDISVLFVPGLGMRASIDISGLRVKYGDEIPVQGIFEVYAPYSQRRNSFFYSNEAGYNGLGVVGNLDQSGNYKNATITNVIEFLEVIGGGGRFIITERRSKREIATFTLKKNKQASNLMRSCLTKII